MSLPEGNKKKGYGVHMDRSVVGGIAAEKDVHINDSVTVCDFYLFLANERQIIQVKK